jgi:hypothetical protein
MPFFGLVTIAKPGLCRARQSFSLCKIYHVYVTAALRAPAADTTTPPDRQDLIRLDGNLYPLMGRLRLPNCGTIDRLPSRLPNGFTIAPETRHKAGFRLKHVLQESETADTAIPQYL